MNRRIFWNLDQFRLISFSNLSCGITDMPIAVVTGSAGFVGSEICRHLLGRGFTVRGTVRSVNSERSKDLLAALSSLQPNGSISLVEADLLNPGSFDTVLEGADYLFHVASPFAIIVNDQQRDVRGMLLC